MRTSNLSYLTPAGVFFVDVRVGIEIIAVIQNYCCPSKRWTFTLDGIELAEHLSLLEHQTSE